MKTDADRLYELLPAIYRVRDAEQGGPLRALVEVLAGQAAVLSANLDQLYDDQFVETAAPWVLPYLGDLLGIQGLPAEPLTPRAEVADTLGMRRRKGTAHVLERLARGATGLPARAVEFFQLLAWTQNVNHVRRENLAWLPVRGALRLEQLGGPFERLEGRPDLTHNVDVRRIAAGRGRYNIPNVGVFLWRLRAYPLTASPAVPDDVNPTRRFRFSPLGNDTRLFSLPATEEDPVTLAEPANVPAPISRRAFYDDLRRVRDTGAASAFYGTSVAVDADDGTGKLTRVPVERIRVCDLSSWKLPDQASLVSIDPVLGRLAFRTAQKAPPRVTFHYGFPADLGGGEYRRGHPSTDVGTLVHVAEKQTVFGPGVKFATDIAGALGLLSAGENGVIEIGDGGRYDLPATLDATGRRLTLRARDGVRPTLLLDDAAGLTLLGGENDAVTLDGLLITGTAASTRGVVVAGPVDKVEGVGQVSIRHCTLVPGLALGQDGMPLHPRLASLEVRAPECRVTIERSIVGQIRAALDAEIVVDQSILDATSTSRTVLAREENGEEVFGASLTVRECTVIGKVKTDAMVLASDTLFLAEPAPGDKEPEWPGPVLARRRQVGCARFCYLPPRSRTPRRFQCIPRTPAEDGRVRPWPASTRYGSPRYCLLPPSTPAAVRRGAGDEDEIGVYHHLYLSRREAHLRARLDEYLRFGLEAGVFYAS